jgi:putative Mg2+ transporter-C (MgtC) family protein
MTLADIILRLLAAAVIGCSIGLNRFAHHRYIGVRTLGLVALGAAALVVAVLESGSGADQLQAVSRIIQGIVTGIGFIGAGVIVQREQRHKVHGLTTAATVWVSAAAGVVCGLGAWRVAVTATVLVGLVLIAGGPIERRLIDRNGAKLEGDSPSPPGTGPPDPL